jgi:hypothetical protein
LALLAQSVPEAYFVLNTTWQNRMTPENVNCYVFWVALDRTLTCVSVAAFSGIAPAAEEVLKV